MPPTRTIKQQTITKPIPEIKTNDKILDALTVITNPETRVFTMEGSIRSAKTITAIIGFHLRVQKQTAKYALIAAEDYNAIRTNLLEAELGLLQLYPDKYKFSKDPIGGYYIEVIGTDKEILLVGYSDASKWEKILGKDIETILIDECNIADEQFMNESFARQGATEHPITIMTLNGDDPGHKIYTDRVNKSLIIGNCPVSIRADMDRVTIKKRGYYYMHFTFKDNPKLTAKMIRDLNALYPRGSHYHKTRILGERGKWGITIFSDYMTPDLLVDLKAKDQNGKPIYNLIKHAIGVDIAEGRATNVFAIVGFEKDYKYAALCGLMVFPTAQSGRKVGYSQKTELLNAFLDNHSGKPMEGIFVDSAEGNYILDLQASPINRRVPVAGSYKATIKERIDLFITLFTRKRFFFDLSTLQAYQAYQSAVWVKGKEGKEREDNNLPMNDIMDAVEYAITRHMSALLLGLKKL